MFTYYNLSFSKILVSTSLLIGLNQSYAQENPWVNKSTVNPWPKTENIKSNSPDSLHQPNIINKAVETDSTVNINVVSSEQTISEEISDEPISLPVKTLDTKSARELLNIEYQVKSEFSGKNAFIGSFVSSLFLNIFSIPINAICTSVPSKKSKEYLADYQDNHPEASEKEIRAVKKGIRKKRTSRTGLGTLAGIITGSIVLILL